MAIKPLEQRRLQVYFFLMLADVLAILASFVLSGYLYEGTLASDTVRMLPRLMVPSYLFIALSREAYSLRALESWRFAASRAVLALVAAFVLVLVLIFYAKTSETFSRMVVTSSLVLSMVAITFSRWLNTRILRRIYGERMTNVLLIDAGGPEVSLPGAFQLNARAQGISPDISNPEALERIGQCVRGMDRVIVSCPIDKREEWTFVLRASGVAGEVTSEMLHGLGAIGLEKHETFTSLVVSSRPLGLRDRALKRGLDLAVALPALVLLLPLFLIVAVAIRMEDGGPVFFVQRRMGRGNCFFDMLKFRSMRVAQLDAHGARSTSRNDDRVTRVGRFIRSTSIDELPQLLNVVKGDMSLVGPRPHALASTAGGKLFWEIDEMYWHRHSLKPGLTGLAQVRGYRGATEKEEDLTNRLTADLEYIREWTPLRDIAIIVATLRVVIHDRAF